MRPGHGLPDERVCSSSSPPPKIERKTGLRREEPSARSAHRHPRGPHHHSRSARPRKSTASRDLLREAVGIPEHPSSCCGSVGPQPMAELPDTPGGTSPRPDPRARAGGTETTITISVFLREENRHIGDNARGGVGGRPVSSRGREPPRRTDSGDVGGGVRPTTSAMGLWESAATQPPGARIEPRRESCSAARTRGRIVAVHLGLRRGRRRGPPN